MFYAFFKECKLLISEKKINDISNKIEYWLDFIHFIFILIIFPSKKIKEFKILTILENTLVSSSKSVVTQALAVL